VEIRANLSNSPLNAQPTEEFQRSALGNFQDRRHPHYQLGNPTDRGL
jgi:hypothetical protein